MVNLSAVNLNLLVAFDAMLAERHVTRAAKRLGVTQSAVSNSLRQLRLLFDDALFVRAPRGVAPTPRAVALGPHVREGLARLEVALGAPEFDPKTAERRFMIAASDFVQLVVLSRSSARRQAPHGEDVVPSIVASSNLSAAIDRRVALAFRLPLRVFEPPVPLASGRVAMVWHEHAETDPAHAWLREAVRKAATP